MAYPVFSLKEIKSKITDTDTIRKTPDIYSKSEIAKEDSRLINFKGKFYTKYENENAEKLPLFGTNIKPK